MLCALVGILSFLSVDAYRLNVPRVLLPYHPSVPVSFVLEVTHPTGGCFSWRSTRPDIVSVKLIDTGMGSKCSDRAEIRSVAKPGGIGSSELSAVIFAEDKGSGTTLSCGVTVDEIATISIETTTKVLFVDAAPARMTVDAFNAEGDRFSTLSEISLDWELSANGFKGERPLRIVPFEQSTYEAPAEIVRLEKNRKKGYVILIEGVSTGSAALTAKFSDSYLQKVKAHTVELAVVANLLLVPSHDLYVPLETVVPFQVLIIKQFGTEVVPMPSSAYNLQVDSSDVAKLDESSSSIRAISRGNTAIHLLSSNVDIRAKAGIRPPSTAIHVTDPESLQWHVSGENWMLQTGQTYVINIDLLDEHGNVMFIGDNLRFSTEIDKSLFRVGRSTRNSTWLTVTPLRPSKTALKSRFVGILDENGREIAQNGRVHGDQQVAIVDPVKIVPSVVFLPALHKYKSNWDFKATGGSGLFEWIIGDSHVASIESSSGRIVANSIGSTVVTAVDKRNSLLTDQAKVHVLDAAGIHFGETVRETFVGSDLVLNIALFGHLPNGSQQVAFHDCRNVPFRVEVGDASLLEHVDDAPSTIPTVGTGCGTVTLNGLASGDTRVVVSFDHFKATIDVSVYEKLELTTDDTAVAIGSSHAIEILGGPRPWILESSNFYRTASNAKNFNVDFDNEKIVVECGAEETLGSFDLRVGNKKSPSLPLPVHATVSVTVCCARPTRLEIVSEKAQPLKCPTSVHALLIGTNERVRLRGYGVCGGTARELQSIDGLEVKWSSSDSKILKVEKTGVEKENLFASLSSKSTSGVATITADVGSVKSAGKLAKHLTAKYEVTVAEPISIDPTRLVLWNEAISTGTFNIHGGSGYFAVEEEGSNNWPVGVALKGRLLQVTPKQNGQTTLRVADACFVGQTAEANVRIADIHSLNIQSPHFVEVGQEVEVEIVAQDEKGETFVRENRALADAALDASNSHAVLRKIDGLRYVLRAESIGSVSLTATAKSTSGRALASRPRVVQIFSPIFLQPKILTLIPESTFQLEVVGGPQPTPPLHFALNSSKVASVEPNALITSKDLGWTSITGTVKVGDGHVSKDTVVLRVVSLGGIALFASSRRIEAGANVHVRLRGLVAGAADEEPFAFGGALYPFKVTWSVSDPSVLQTIHPMGSDVSETNENKFAIWFHASRTGSVTVKVHVELNEKAKKHFVGSTRVLNAETTISVEQPFALVNPEVQVGAVRIAPNSQIDLKTAWPQSSVVYSVSAESSARISVTSSGQLRSGAREGFAAVTLRRKDSTDNETNLVPVLVSRVHSLDVQLLNELKVVQAKAPLLGLPVGAEVQLQVVFRDSKGRQLIAAANKINYRPHRFDLTDITATNNNNTLAIVLKAPGETVLQISDATTREIATFVRLSAAETLLPTTALRNLNDLLVSDILCFQPAVVGENLKWSSKSSNEGRIQWISGESGVARLAKEGATHVTSKTDVQTLHSNLVIHKPHALRFTDRQKPSIVSNDDSNYVFTITTATNNTKDKSTSIYGDCSAEQQKVLEKDVVPPFECFVEFVSKGKNLPAVNWLSASPVFDKDFGYGCKIARFDDSLTSTPLSVPPEMEKNQFDVQVTARWNLDGTKIEQATIRVPFYFALRVEEKELALSNADHLGAALSIWAPRYHKSDIVVRGCEGEIVKIVSTSQTAKHVSHATHFYNVLLNVKSAALFSELAKTCHVTVENAKTSQVIRVPVKVRLVDEAAKHVYNALESKGMTDIVLIVLQKYSHLIPSMMATCVVGIAVILAFLYIKYNYLERRGSYNDTSRFNETSMHHTSIASSVPSSPSSSAFFRDSPIFKSTPIAGSPAFLPNNRLRHGLGSGGDGRLWTSDNKNSRC
ncbi:unnamed protein product [Caenorhabditis auriculariae]|uniref:BIG2 domain-containing protein n=1 Tax=Caenorhabditis auriculariae TaxID=2777116 RepID=A0A8S1GS27_9PELO|nr:unnamed protein product [Caenorhabditis auriculariae]